MFNQPSKLVRSKSKLTVLLIAMVNLPTLSLFFLFSFFLYVGYVREGYVRVGSVRVGYVLSENVRDICVNYDYILL